MWKFSMIIALLACATAPAYAQYDRAQECWNPRAGHFEGVRPGETQNDLDFSRCRPVGDYRASNRDVPFRAAVPTEYDASSGVGGNLAEFANTVAMQSSGRIQLTAQYNGQHSFKFGGDVNHLPVKADFTVNFGGIYNFGELSGSQVSPAFASFPNFSAVQAYGLGLPQVFLQGIGNQHDEFSRLPMLLMAARLVHFAGKV